MIAKIATLSLSLSLSLGLGLGPGLAHAETLTLQEGLHLVTTQGYEMRMAVATEEAAGKGEDLARSRWLPHVNAYADQTWLQYQPESIFGAGTVPLGDESFMRYGVTVNQLVTDFGQTGSDIKAARANARGQAAETESIRNKVALDFLIAYVSLLQAEKTLIVADLEVQRFESHVADAKMLHEAGEVTLNDVLVTEVALANAGLRRITLRDERNLAESKLNYLILRPLDIPTTVADFPFQLDPIPDLADISTRASANQQVLKILDERIAAKEAQLSSKEAESLPTLFVSGGYAYEENSYRVHEGNWSARLGLTWDLYTGGAQSAAQKQAMDELAVLIAQREQARELVLLGVRDFHRLLTGAVESTSVTRKAASQARESLRLFRSMYTEGEANATDVTDAVTALARAEENHLNAIYGRLKAEARLLYAAGDDLGTLYSNAEQVSSSNIFNAQTGENQ
ncbi:MAG: TolC family protein [bacterium]|nr:TolC family protein [bacterium]MDT8366796.1 TolC family protein [bacterium]